MKKPLVSLFPLFSICSTMKTQRISDPIYKMIVFDDQQPLDMTAWRLLNTPDVQRLRRIKQLGVSEFVFPSATHSRFAHSAGVFENARRLLGPIRREIELGRAAGEFDEHRAKVSVLTALLHDIGHGPFSHAFEESRKSIAERRHTRATVRKHEHFTAAMVLDSSGQVGEILTDAKVDPKEVAELVEAETPQDMYQQLYRVRSTQIASIICSAIAT
jgi:HD superfamily phosphohydrolase